MLTTRLTPPQSSHDLVIRQRLCDRLEADVEKPLTLVSAPAGYGKSVAVSHWFSSTSTPGAWLSIDSDLDDLRTFVEYWIHSIRTLYPDSHGQTLAFLQQPALPPVETIGASFLHELSLVSERFISVLDDYHLIKQNDIHEFLNNVLRSPPVNMHLVLITRRDPPIVINRLRTYEKLNEFRMSDLMYNLIDTQELYLALSGKSIDQPAAEKILEKTEGWVLAIRHVIGRTDNVTKIDSVFDPYDLQSRRISNYLLNEFFVKLSPETRNALLISSIFDRFTLSVLDHVLQADGVKEDITGRVLLRDLYDHDISFFYLDDDKEWIRYHHLFQEEVLNQLIKTFDRHRLDRIYLAASEWFEGKGLIDEAIRYAVAFENYERAEDIIQRQSKESIDLQRYWIIEKWVARIPREVQLSRPNLILAQMPGWEETFRIDEMTSGIAHLEMLVKPGSVEYAVMHIYKAFLSVFVHGKPKEAIEFLNLAKPAVAISDSLFYRATFYLTVAYQMTGQLDKARAHLEHLALTLDPNDAFKLANVKAIECFLHLSIGEFREAMKVADYFAYAMKGVDMVYAVVYSYYLVGNCAFQLFDTQKAASFFEKVMSAPDGVSRHIALEAFLGAAILYAMTDNQEGAAKALAKAEKFLSVYPNDNLELLLQSARMRVQLLNNDLSSSLAWALAYDSVPQYHELNYGIEVPAITRFRILIASGNPEYIESALNEISILETIVRGIHNDYYTSDLVLLKAIAEYRIGNPDAAKELFRKAAEMLQSYGGMRPFIEAGPVVLQLFDLAEPDLLRIPAVKSVKRIMRKYNRIQAGNTVNSPEQTNISLMDDISMREREVIQSVSEGMRNKEIADHLSISEETVKSHLQHVFKKLNVRSRVELIQKVRKSGLMT